jgi:8-oxo-dGTP pyrophosphatase MutT (NUDIX family)
MRVLEKKIGVSSDGREMHYSAGVLLECNGKYLLMDRVNPPPGFACPAGHVDIGEDSKDAAVREIKEETGIDLDEITFLCEEEVPWNYCKSATVHYWYLYKASVVSEVVTIEKNEAKSYGWYTPLELKNMNLEEVWLYWFKKQGII